MPVRDGQELAQGIKKHAGPADSHDDGISGQSPAAGTVRRGVEKAFRVGGPPYGSSRIAPERQGSPSGIRQGYHAVRRHTGTGGNDEFSLIEQGAIKRLHLASDG